MSEDNSGLGTAQAPAAWADMPGREAVAMMQRASAEIKDLRRVNNAMAPKAEAYDLILKIMDLVPGRASYHSEDVAAMLDRRIEQIVPKK